MTVLIEFICCLGGFPVLYAEIHAGTYIAIERRIRRFTEPVSSAPFTFMEVEKNLFILELIFLPLIFLPLIFLPLNFPAKKNWKGYENFNKLQVQDNLN